MARRARQISLKECYEILRLEKGADLQAVKHAYRKRAFELHPDLNPGNAEASRQFQLLNEAYVALTAMLRPAEEAREQAAKQQQATEQTQSETATEQTQAEQESKSADREAEKASAAYAEQDVLRDLLNDPFARRVFEDIYSELNRKNEKPETPTEEPPKEKIEKEKKPEPAVKRKEAKIVPLWEEGKDKGVKRLVKGWLKRQIDDEQTLRLPAARLAPGRKVRLQIRRGISDEVSEVEVTLPPDFVPGKPVRLRGLGRRVGPWQGDLYLTISPI